jgi:SNF2 family DNA or RNA helicase
MSCATSSGVKRFKLLENENTTSLQYSNFTFDGLLNLTELCDSFEISAESEVNFASQIYRYLEFYPEESKKLNSVSGLRIQDPAATPLRTNPEPNKDSTSSGTSFSLSELLKVHFVESTPIPLMDFQKRGVDWLLASPKRLLADDMGLGKTIQTIAAINQLIKKHLATRVLIIAPRSLLLNWAHEFKKWAPNLCATVLNPSSSDLKTIWSLRIGKSHVVITSFEQLRLCYKEIPNVFDLIVVDEAHKIRNSDSGISRAFKTLKAQRTWFLTGTPVERDAEDLATLLSLLDPKRFSITDEKLGLGLLRNRAEEFLLRRIKADVLSELPSISYHHEVLTLSDKQSVSYKNELLKPNKNVLYKLGRLMQICDMDQLSGESSKIDRIIDLVRQITSLNERCVIFSFWKAPLLRLAEVMNENNLPLQLLTADMTLPERQQAVEKFRNGSGSLLASGRIASEGLTLIEANHAIFLNRWWNPSANSQAEDRIRRIGQTRKTEVYTFTMSNSVESVIDRILQDKESTINTLIELLNESFSSSGVSGRQ